MRSCSSSERTSQSCRLRRLPSPLRVPLPVYRALASKTRRPRQFCTSRILHGPLVRRASTVRTTRLGKSLRTICWDARLFVRLLLCECCKPLPSFLRHLRSYPVYSTEFLLVSKPRHSSRNMYNTSFVAFRAVRAVCFSLYLTTAHYVSALFILHLHNFTQATFTVFLFARSANSRICSAFLSNILCLPI